MEKEEVKYAISLAEDGRILSATLREFAPRGSVFVRELPAGNINEYRYSEGAYVHDPVPKEEQEEAMGAAAQLEQLQEEVLAAYLGQAELYERLLLMEEENLNTMLALAELYEAFGGHKDG